MVPLLGNGVTAETGTPEPEPCYLCVEWEVPLQGLSQLDVSRCLLLLPEGKKPQITSACDEETASFTQTDNRPQRAPTITGNYHGFCRNPITHW
jgi:hypothetical protein